MHARCNLGVHDMNNTILMVWSEGLRRQFCSLIKRNVFVSGPGKAASYRYQISCCYLQADKTNKGNETIQCHLSVCTELGRHKYMELTGGLLLNDSST